MRVAEILRNKGSSVVTIETTSTITELLARLAGHNVGALVVTGEQGGLAGIVSERDVVRRLHERGPELLAARVAEIMTADVVTCSPDDSVESLTVTMTQRRVRHVPVVSGGQLVGLVSIGDAVKSRISQLEQDSEQLAAYITQADRMPPAASR